MDKPKLILIRPKCSSEADLREAAEKLDAALTGKGNREQPVELPGGSGQENEGSSSVSPDEAGGEKSSEAS